MKILIIGGTGLVGPHLIYELLQLGHDISILNRSGKKFFTENVIKCNRSDFDVLATKLKEIHFDLCIDMIPFRVEEADNLKTILDDLKMPLIALSSIDVYAAYGKLHQTEDLFYQDMPLSEEAPLRKRLGIDGKKYDKIGIEESYLDLEDITIFRLPAVYGWPDTTRIDQYLIPMLSDSTEVKLSPNKASWLFSRGYCKNIAYAISKSIELRGKNIFNIADEKTYTELEWVKKIAGCIRWSGEIVLDDTATDECDFKQDWQVDITKMKDQLQYHEKYDVEEGFKEMIFFSAYQKLNKPYHKFY